MRIACPVDSIASTSGYYAKLVGQNEAPKRKEHMKVEIKVLWRNRPMLSWTATTKTGELTLGIPKVIDEKLVDELPEKWQTDLQKIVLRHCKEFYLDPRYCSFFDETGTIETQIKL